MMDGDWIAMPGVPLITAAGPAAAAPEEGEAAGVAEGEAGTAEDATAPDTEERHGGDATGPAIEGERAETTAGAAPSAPAGLEAAPASEGEVAPAAGDAVAATVSAGDATVDASEAAHAAELEATLLAASSPGGEGPAEAAVEATEASAVLDEAAVVAEGAEV
jgi:hypothetical protein